MNDEQIIKSTVSVFYRLFFNYVPSLMADLKHGIDYAKSTKEKHSYKNEKGKKFKNEEAFVLDAKARNNGHNVEMKTTTVKSGRKDLKEIIKACKKRGVDVYVREKPKDFDLLVNRYNANDNLSIREKEMLDAFCDFDNDGNITNIHDDGGVLMFKAEDIQQVEEAIKDVDQKSLNIQRRKQKAKERFKTEKDAREITKALDKAIGKAIGSKYYAQR